MQRSARDVSLAYAKEPARFRREATAAIEAGARVVFVDEVQRVPALLDEVHALIESTKARFILTGSSARKLRRGGANLLAGRAVTRRLHPLTMRELGNRLDLERALRLGTLPTAGTLPDVVTECIRMLDYISPETQAFFWRTHMGAEVDLVFVRHGKIRAAVEVKSRSDVGGSDFSGLRTFHDAHPDAARFLVCTAARASRRHGVDILPFGSFFKRIEEIV